MRVSGGNFAVKLLREGVRVLWRIKGIGAGNKLHQFDIGHGLKINYPLSTAIGFALFLRGFETAELEFFCRQLKPGDTVFDIGANGGIFTAAAAKCVGDKGQVFAFEPGKRELEILKENLRLNNLDNVSVIEKAVSNFTGRSQFAIARDGAMSSLAETGHPDQQIENWAEVDTISLDRFARERGVTSVDFVKIDVEGAEKLVFEGAVDLMKANPQVCILFEAYELNTVGFGYSVRPFLESLRQDGFHLFYFEEGGRLRKIDDFRPEYGGKEIQNFVATRMPEMIMVMRV